MMSQGEHLLSEYFTFLQEAVEPQAVTWTQPSQLHCSGPTRRQTQRIWHKSNKIKTVQQTRRVTAIILLH